MALANPVKLSVHSEQFGFVGTSDETVTKYQRGKEHYRVIQITVKVEFPLSKPVIFLNLPKENPYMVYRKCLKQLQRSTG